MPAESDVRIERGDVLVLDGKMAKITDFGERITAIENGEPIRETTVEYFHPDSDYVTGDLVPSHAIKTATLGEFLELVDDE